MYDPLCNSMDISKSPHLVKRLEAKDPNGSTVAPNSKYSNMVKEDIRKVVHPTTAEHRRKVYRKC